MRNSRDKTDRVRALVACADPEYGTTVADQLATDGLRVEQCHDAQGVLRLTGRRGYEVIVFDLVLDDEGDVDLLSFIRREQPSAQVIILFDVMRIERAIEGIRKGAFFYLPRTAFPSDVALVAAKATRSLAGEAAVSQLEQSLLDTIAGGSPAMSHVVRLIRKVAPTNSTVLLLGESGTGKDLLANTLHRLSARKEQPFVAVNCAALPENLLESELFGHVKGAFTGADRDRVGLFEEADGGTIFLDEIGDMSLVTQAKLLRVLQSGEVRPVGSSETRRVDVRILAATNIDLVEAVREHAFREDLYFRLNVIQIRIPPLRDRPEALPTLVAHFLRRSNQQFGKAVQRFDGEAEALLRAYPYPGNVRELESIIAHAVIMSEGEVIRAVDLPEQVRGGHGLRPALPNYARGIPTLKEMEEELIRNALDHCDRNQSQAAKLLGISRSTLWRKMKEYGIAP